ncbi:hypothetical protein [Saccharopolyspora taberi]|uniref:hypothetical protein n=1 Tax=Saccharopolyspora taberi TaxID=60895 RepID=UPI0031DE7C83
MRTEDLIASADALERLAATSTGGEWQLRGLLATRPEVVAHHGDGTTEHVAEARAGSARWIAALSPELAPLLAEWLRSAARRDEIDPAAHAFARALLRRLPD